MLLKLDTSQLNKLRDLPLFKSLTTLQFAQLIARSKQHILHKDDYLFHQGDILYELFICLEGCIKLIHITPNGDEKIIEIISKDQSFAEAVLFLGGKSYPVHAVAIKSACVLGINATQYETILRSSIDQCFSVMGLLSKRMHWLLNEVDRLTLCNATFRLVFYLLDIKNSTANCTLIALDVPKHIIASRLSIKPETLSRILKRLSDDKLIGLHEDHIELLDIPAMETIVRTTL